MPASAPLSRGVLAAVLAAVVGAIAWAVLTVATNYKIGFAAVGIGLLVGKAIEMSGSGHKRLPVVGAVVALVGCFVGDFLADAHVVAKGFNVSITDVLSKSLQHFDLAKAIYTGGFHGMDLLFYAIAAYEGLVFGRRAVARVHNQLALAAVPGTSWAAPATSWAAPTGPVAPAPTAAAPLPATHEPTTEA